MSENKEIIVSKPNDLAEREKAAVMERVVLAGDLSKLDPSDRAKYYAIVCHSVGLNPYTKPFDLIVMNGKMILYANRTCTDQLRTLQEVSITELKKQKDGDIYMVTACVKNGKGRTDESIGAVNIKGLSGDSLANAYMKAETKAKRRATLSIVGLGWIDESEVDSIAGAQKVHLDLDTGEVKQNAIIAPDGSKNAATGQPGVLKPIIPPEVTVRINQIKYLQSELKLSEINFKDLLFTVHGLETLKGLTLIQYDQIISHLIELIEDEKAPPAEIPLDKDPKEGMQELR